MVSLELFKEVEKDFFFHLFMSMGQRKTSVPHEESNFKPSDSTLHTELQLNSSLVSLQSQKKC